MVQNELYYGDNLDILRRYIEKETVDLVYLDPPFNSNQDYNVLFQERNGTRAAAQVKAFEDTWRWDQVAAAEFHDVSQGGGRPADVMVAFEKFLGHSDMLAYLSRMAPRLVELRRVLKSTGSIYLHCDPTASHYLKILMDAIFEPQNFRSEITWRRKGAHNKLSRQFGPIHDTILFYTKSDDFAFHPGKKPYPKSYIEGWFRKSDSRGRYRQQELTGPGRRSGSSGQPWRGFDPTPKGRHWAVPSTLRDLVPDGGEGMTTQEKLDYVAGLPDCSIEFPKDGWPTYKQYVGDGVPYQDIWAYQPGTSGVLWGTDEAIDEDIAWLEAEAERLGFQTQKPEGLLDRIIRSSSDEGDTVLDPFCGCGTTIVVAQRLNRRWIGIDITHLAVTLMKHRLKSAFGDIISYKVIGEPVSLPDAEALARQDPYQFQWWALGLVGARPEETKRGTDRGIDGSIYFFPDRSTKGKAEQILFSVKAGNVTVSHVRDLRGVVEREKATIGVLISLNPPTRPMREEAASAGFYASEELAGKAYPRIQLLTIADLLMGKTIECPPYVWKGNATFRAAPRERMREKQAKQVMLREDSTDPETGVEGT